jgi:teichuronic acid biosynthesis glycosyltransferase TuaG
MISQEKATISVVTPAHDAAGVLERAVRSVASQSLPVLEHIVVDDGSTDETGRLLAELSRRFPHLRTVVQPRRGAAAARNAGIARAGGRYIAFLDSDDEWNPGKLERQIGFMEETGTLFSYGDYQRFHVGRSASPRTVRTPEELRYPDLLRGCPIGCLTVAYNQEALGKRYMPAVKRGQDWGLWLELTRDGTVGRRYPGIEAIYHSRDGSLSRRKVSKALDIYRLYRDQERLGVLTSGRYLIEHSLRSFMK